MTDHDGTLRHEAQASVYDSEYQAGSYDRPYYKSHYYPMYRGTLDEIRRLGGQHVLEVGCGSGRFAQLLFDRTRLKYSGFDFSKTAVEKAIRRTGRSQIFHVGDALAPESYACAYDTIVCTEVLEHIARDREVIVNWRSQCACVCSVPNFDDDTHVRIFRREEEVIARYRDLIDIDRILRVSRSLLRGRSLREYFRQLRWSRDNPRRLLALLGYNRFDNLEGWFIFSGHRR